MANVWLTREQCKRDELPPVCAKCGAATDRVVPRRFTWCPWWFVLFIAFSLIGLLVAYLVLRKRMLVHVPLCGRHASEWRRHGLFGWISLVACAGLFFAGLAVGEGHRTRRLGATIAIAGLLGFVVCLIVVAAWGMFLIRPRKITRDEILLTGVALEFTDAVDDDRGRRFRRYGEFDDEDDDDDRPRRRNRYEGDED